ncbi:MAG: PEP-CTERM sorting domain-containing protein, partial [Pirellulales bacterium]|nr:PEP-CTERM sorting domain-containing protein [Pirellulales bacterium]
MSKRLSLGSYLAASVVLAIGTIAAADTIGWNFVSDYPAPTIQGDGFADGFDQWTDSVDEAAPDTGTEVPNSTDTWAITTPINAPGVSVEWSSTNMWVAGDEANTEQALYRIYLDDGAPGVSVTVSGLASWLAATGDPDYHIRFYRSTDWNVSDCGFSLINIFEGYDDTGTLLETIPQIDQGNARMDGDGPTGRLDTGANARDYQDTTLLFTADTITFRLPPRTDPIRGTLAGFRITSGIEYDPTLKLVINRDTGNVTLINYTNSTVEFAGISLLSSDGALTPGNWDSITENYDAPPQNGSVSSDDWILFSSTESDLSEGTLGKGLLAHNQSVNLGDGVWYQYYRENTDLSVEYLDANTGETIRGIVEFTGNGNTPFMLGDVDFDNDIDAVDWVAVRDGFNADYSSTSAARAYRSGDMNRDLVVNYSDLIIFKEEWEAAHPGSSFADMVAGIPEPATGCLFGLSLFFLGAIAAKRRSWLRIRSVLPLLVAVVIAIFSLSSPVSADMAPGAIPGVTGMAYHQGDNPDPGDGSFSRILDGSGLTAGLGGPNNWLHDAAWPNNWQGQGTFTTDGTTGDTAGSWFIADLGSSYADLAALMVWNVREVLDRGSQSVDLYYATSPTVAPVTGSAYSFSSGGWISLGNHTIPRATAGGTMADTTIDLGGVSSARYIGFDILTNHGSDFRVGFAELEFFTVNPYDQVYQLTLEVNTTTGNLRILNDGMAEVQDIDYFEITSSTAALDSTNWTPLGSGTNDGSDWEELGNLTSSLLAQFYLQGSQIFAEGESATISNAYTGTGQAQDPLEFRYHIPGQANLIEGLVTYIAGPAENADFDGDGDVDGADYLTWQKGFGTTGTGTLATGDANGDTNVDSADLAIWKSQFGTGGAPAGLASGAVPEPSTFGLLALALAGCVVPSLMRRPGFFHHHGGRMMRWSQFIWLAAGVALFLFAPAAIAGYTLDRLYHLGDDPMDEYGSGAIAGSMVTVTVDSFATSAPGDQQDFYPGILGAPKYVNVGTIGTGRTGLGVQFSGPDGTGGGDYLEAARLGAPDTSAASTGYVGLEGAGPLDYSGIVHRGFQAWAYPASPGAGLQDIIMDTLAHGVRISAEGTWVMRYWSPPGSDTVPDATDDFDTGIAVTSTWHHIQVVRAPRTGDPDRGSTFYLDGVAVAFGPGGYYDGDSNQHP